MRDIMSDEDKKAIREWLDKGNKVEVCPSGAHTPVEELTYTWGTKKKKPTDAK